VRRNKKSTKENVQKEKLGRWNISLPRIVPYAAARCISVKENTENFFAVAIIPIAKVQEK
jgi:hypothetical protein